MNVTSNVQPFGLHDDYKCCKSDAALSDRAETAVLINGKVDFKYNSRRVETLGKFCTRKNYPGSLAPHVSDVNQVENVPVAIYRSSQLDFD